MTHAEKTAQGPFVGRWRIVEMELWTADELDLVGPARLTLERDGGGTMHFVAVDVALDYRVGQRDGQRAIEFSFDGTDEGDPVSGRGWAVLTGDDLRGRIFFHDGDDSAFRARRGAHAIRGTRR